MAEHQLELRLRAAARALDADAPAFDAAVLRVSRRRVSRRALVALAVVACLGGLTVAPAAISALGELFGVDSVPELSPVVPGVAPAFPGRAADLDEARASVPFPVRTIPALGTPSAATVRDDIAGGLVTLTYDGRIALAQWSVDAVDARVAVVPVEGVAEEVTAGRLRALWLAGAARGTFTLVGADGTVHRELFEVAAGALLWRDGRVGLLLQGAGSKERALELAGLVAP